MNLSHDFLGEEVSNGSGGNVFVVSVPIELSTSYMKGAGASPRAIIEASRQIELYNSELGIDLEGAGIVTVDPGVEDKEGLLEFLSAHREKLAGAFTCFIGGEHSITPWILEGMGYGEIGIVWIDAHADLRSQYLGNPESHACAARNSMKYGPVVEIGIRSWSSEESVFMKNAAGVRVFREFDNGARKAIEALPDKVYLSVDYDGIDPSIIRAVGTPEPGGLTWKELSGIFSLLFSTKEVVGMDAVELCPSDTDEVSNFIAAKVIYEAISRFLAREAER